MERRTYNPCDECPYGIERRDGSGNDAMCRICEFNDFSKLGNIDHIRDLLHAEKDGRLVVLPCKVGASIFRLGVNEVLDYWQVEHAEVYEDEVVMVDDSDNFFTADDIGKSVFLTREEAEAALEAQKCGDEG